MEIADAAAAVAAYVNSGELEVTEGLPEAADAFARACRALNERLALCDGYLNAHQRSEALRLATAPPDVLRLFGVLDLKEWARWAETARHLRLPVPPRLNDRAAARIHGAFVAEQKVVPLLQELRRLALERAPLYQRLEALRRLAAAEPTNLVWADDLRAHEAARLEEIRDLLADPAYYRDWQVICGLLEELSGGWLTPTPADVAGRLEKHHGKFLRQVGDAVERELRPKLERAVAADDAGRVRVLHGRLTEVANRYRPPPASPVWALLRLAEEHLQQDRADRARRRAFERAVGAARAALADGAGWDEVEERYERVLAFREFEPPADVARAFAARGRGRQTTRVLLAGGAVVALLSGVALYFALAR